MPTHKLREHWRKIYRTEPPRRIPRDLLMRAVAYQIQERALGGLDQKTKRRLRTLARTLETDGRLPISSGPSLKPGAKLIREWHGKTYRVAVLEDGFEFDGERYRSLSRIAQEITGAHWSGRRFFGLAKKEQSPPALEGESS
ncbi:MAG TPA: DUF2924 domain-containing protein [Nitrospinae bacterium]|nr:DUF2924 domain-containing protein [Nitrospinota bacterium]